MRLNRTRDDNGSIVIALSVMMIVSALAVVSVQRSTSGLRNTKKSQDYGAALAKADAGVSDALFRIDQLALANATSFCVGASASCTATAVPGSTSTQYKAVAANANKYQISSKGIVNGEPHAVTATLERSRAYPFAIFGASGLDFNGNSNGNIRPVNADGTPATTFDADAGSNGTISCSGGNPANHHVVYAGGSTDCANRVDDIGPYNPLPPISGPCPAPTNTPITPCLPTSYLPCPGSGTIPASVAPGVYRCTTSITFPSTFSVGAGAANGGVVEIFILPSSGSLDMTMSGSDLNVGGDPTKLRIYMAGAGSVNVGNGSHAGAFTGILYAPQSNMTSNGCKVEWRGALTFNTARCNGGPHLDIQYDARVNSLVSQNWILKNFREVPVTEFNLTL
jgi:hypothetical protein